MSTISSLHHIDLHELAHLNFDQVPDLNKGTPSEIINNYETLLKKVENFVKEASPQTVNASFYQDAYTVIHKCERAIRQISSVQKTKVLGHCTKIENIVVGKLWREQEKNFDAFCKEDLNIKDQARINNIKKEFGIDSNGTFQIEGDTLILSKQALATMKERFFWPLLKSMVESNPTLKKVQISGDPHPIPIETVNKLLAKRRDSKSDLPPVFGQDVPVYFTGKEIGTLEVEEIKKGKGKVTTTLPIRSLDVDSFSIKGSYLELLALDCPYFETSLAGAFIEAKNKQIVLPEEITPKTFEEGLECLYGKGEVTKENLLPLLYMANYYNLSSLTDKCCQFMSKQLDRLYALDDKEIGKVRSQFSELQSQFPNINLGPAYGKYYEKALSNAIGSPRFFTLVKECLDKKIPITSLNLTNKFTSLDWDAHFEALSQFPTLKSMHIEARQFGDKDFKGLGQLHLDRLSFKGGKFTGEGLKHLQNMPLKTLKLTLSSSLVDLSHLPKLTTLKNLNLSCCFALPPGEMKHISGLSALEKLNLHATSLLDDTGLKHLSGMPHLKILNLSENEKITDKGIQHLPSGLTELNLKKCTQINDQALLYIGSSLSKLKKLDIALTPVTDRGLQFLTGFENVPPLHELNLNYCKNITHIGVEALLVRLSLEGLYLNETPVDPQAVRKSEDAVFKAFGRKIKDLQISPPQVSDDYIPYY
ncbi:BTB/POZ domain-containing protein [Candidatus Protochlamydia phocaeensis]|uniref:BTB/POZ domain-containing protein n=1 Tax=Candidatus Protochlamydia phocaeensis TaxID=1414722 RepID=UPI0008399395|nr:BTB/POZ domain-containing protein [Candidatus Protochlamydia phocaeensis]